MFRLIAFIRLFSGTISDSIACRLGMLNVMSDPLMNPITSTCQNSTAPVKSSRPMTTVITAFPVCETITRYLRGILSASAPPTGDTSVIGTEKLAITHASATGESSVSRSTSHARVIICMFIARNDTNEPATIHRKSRYRSDSNIGCRRSENGEGFVTSSDDAAVSSGVRVRWSKIYRAPKPISCAFDSDLRRNDVTPPKAGPTHICQKEVQVTITQITRATPHRSTEI